QILVVVGLARPFRLGLGLGRVFRLGARLNAFALHVILLIVGRFMWSRGRKRRVSKLVGVTRPSFGGTLVQLARFRRRTLGVVGFLLAGPAGTLAQPLRCVVRY